jgi:hypothetical protein
MLAKIKLIFTILKGGIDMVVVYVALIVAGRKTYAQVPAILKEAVKAELIALDLEELTVEA